MSQDQQNEFVAVANWGDEVEAESIQALLLGAVTIWDEAGVEIRGNRPSISLRNAGGAEFGVIGFGVEDKGRVNLSINEARRLARGEKA